MYTTFPRHNSSSRKLKTVATNGELFDSTFDNQN